MTTASSAKSNNNVLKIAALVGVGVLVFAGYSYAKFANRLRIIPKDLRLGGNLLFPSVTVTFIVQNNSDVNVKFNYINGTVMYKSDVLGFVRTDNQTKDLTPNQSVTIDLQLDTTLDDDVEFLVNVIKNGLRDEFYFDGVIGVDGVRVPVKEKIG